MLDNAEGARRVAVRPPTAELLSALRARDVKVWLQGDRLRLSAPPDALTAEMQAELTRRKSEIVDYLRAATVSPEIPPLLPAPRDQDLPLSFAQERLWFLQKLDPESVVYNLQADVPLLGPLDLSALERALFELVRRHEPLRTCFEEREGRPVQVILAPSPVEVPLNDLTSLGEAERRREAERLATEEVRRPFDLQHGPVFRVRLLRLTPVEHHLLVTQHHVVTDGWSIALLVEEVLALYGAFAAGRPSPLPEPRLQYADFARWQREWLQGEVLERQLSFWRERLRGAPLMLELPTDRPRPPVESFRGANLTFELPRDLCGGLHALSRAEGVTLFMTLLAAFKVLLARHSGQEDVVVGTANGNRSLLETERMLGFFVNSIVLRTDLSGDPTVRELLALVRKTTLEAQAHGDLPFEKLVEELKPERDLSRSPVFQVLFVMQNTPLEALARKGGEGVIGERGTAAFDLSLYLMETEQGLTGTLEYSTDLFDLATIRRLQDHYRRLLEGMVADPGQRLSEMPFLSEEERRLLASWNETSESLPTASLPEMFESRAASTPEAVAVVSAGESLTYAELDRRASRLAARLGALGVRPGTLVGVFLERSTSMPVGLLGILKSGGGYVPLDADYPRERLAHMLAESRPAVVLTQRDLLDRLPTSDAARLCVDDPLEEDGAARFSIRPADGDLAYVIFTSGSTGRPKGVGVTHAALRNVVASVRRLVGLSEGDTLLAVTTLCFDIASLEMLLPVVGGGRVVVARREDVADPRALARLLETNEATVMQATPATWRMLLDASWPGAPRLKVMCGGEALTAELARALRTRCGALWNMYGPTETAIYSVVHRVEEVEATVPIGRPVANTRIHLLDRNLQPVPVGVVGELCIGGVGVARGYLGRPDLTAERFVPDPLSDEPGTRLYRTGDRARWRGDGSLECLGRVDDQVKLRGFRIEPGEIEAALLGHEAIRFAVVQARESDAADRQLVAYVVLGEGQEPTVTQLRAFLRQTLPAYMIPSSFVTLDSLPLTSTGKVDRRALAALVSSRRQAAPAVEPRTPMERLVAEAWGEALGIDRLSVHDNFFDLGGHSLLSLHVLARVERELGLRLNPRELIFQTLEQFAAVCEARVSSRRAVAGDGAA
jgi:amino acid adenylation domain-containing protein